MGEKFEIICELIQNTGYISKLVLTSEIAMNDGDIEVCQKNTKQAQVMLKTCIDDVFQEFLEVAKNKSQECNDYDLPSGLELAKQISCLQYDCAVFLLLDNSSQSVLSTAEMKIVKDLNTIKQIYQEIYGN